MVDYELNSEFDFYANGSGELATVRGREEFQQDVIVAVHFKLDELVGLRSSSNVLEERVRLIASRVARDHDLLEEVKSVSTERTSDENTLSVQIVYDSGESFQQTI